MPASSMCPCDACFNAPYPTQQEIAARTQAQRKYVVVHLPTPHLPSFLSLRKGPTRLQRTASIASATSSLVGLKGAAEPMAVIEE
ncbi:hypothetical protein NKR19_g7226 [Coniochaeta hoffmannii]|uniref:Uncharacterized protein n=1 Tax=Coniochaeta hoffmannii TaxID=91930 RepID=A0AA38RLR8_9PEZI|nr:hypothetical protein NKR19_g7226 [Coniochaeta hoffmannii]